MGVVHSILHPAAMRLIYATAPDKYSTTLAIVQTDSWAGSLSLDERLVTRMENKTC